ncbi:MAG: ATP-binding protein, partial [Candidatus Micrarchaeaceae archaeon]
SGKSILSWLILKNEKFGYINFLDERLAGIEKNDLERIVQAFYELYGNVEYMIFDEIHRVESWEGFVSRLRTNKRLIITGSNSSMLSGDLSTFLTGRHIDFTLFPFDFKEHMLMHDYAPEKNFQYSSTSIARIKAELEDYIKKGGFPEVHKFGTIVLEAIYRDIINNDIIGKHALKKSIRIRELVKYLVSNFGKEITFRRLAGLLDIKNPHTASKYISYVVDSYLIILLERFSYKLKQQFIAPKKVYCIDTGIINTMAFNTSENSGRLMENVVLVELLRRKSYSGLRTELYYWKDHQGREVDFVVKEADSVKQLIQVTHISDRKELEARESKALVEAANDLHCSNLAIITWDYEGKEVVDGKTIGFIPLWKWLLQNSHGTV